MKNLPSDQAGREAEEYKSTLATGGMFDQAKRLESVNYQMGKVAEFAAEAASAHGQTLDDHTRPDGSTMMRSRSLDQAGREAEEDKSTLATGGMFDQAKRLRSVKYLMGNVAESAAAAAAAAPAHSQTLEDHTRPDGSMRMRSGSF